MKWCWYSHILFHLLLAYLTFKGLHKPIWNDLWKTHLNPTRIQLISERDLRAVRHGSKQTQEYLDQTQSVVDLNKPTFYSCNDYDKLILYIRAGSKPCDSRAGPRPIRLKIAWTWAWLSVGSWLLETEWAKQKFRRKLVDKSFKAKPTTQQKPAADLTSEGSLENIL